MTAYRKAADVAKIGDDLVANEPDHAHLRGVRIEYLFRDKPATHGGRIVLGSARRVGGMGAVLGDLKRHAGNVTESPRPLFVIEVPETIWQVLDDDKRRALVDHELMHCRATRDEDTGEHVLKIRPHDFEEFAAILRRHGLWTTAAQNAGGAAAEQLALAIDDVIAGAEQLIGDDPGDGEV